MHEKPRQDTGRQDTPRQDQTRQAKTIHDTKHQQKPHTRNTRRHKAAIKAGEIRVRVRVRVRFRVGSE